MDFNRPKKVLVLKLNFFFKEASNYCLKLWDRPSWSISLKWIQENSITEYWGYKDMA